MVTDRLSVNDSGHSSKSLGSQNIPSMRKNAIQPEVSELSEGVLALSSKGRKYSKEFDNKKRKKSKFGLYGNLMSSKKLINDSIDSHYKSSRRLVPEIGVFGFIKGGGTTPLVTGFTENAGRNDNKADVYERLKYF